MYVYSQNYDNVTMYYYMHFTTLLHVIYCMYFHYMYTNTYMTWLRITGVLLLRLSQSLFTYARQTVTANTNTCADIMQHA